MNIDTREELEQLTRSRSQPQRLIQRAQIILRAAAGLDNDAIGAELKISRQKAGRWRSRFAERGMDGILNEEPGRGRPRSISPRKRAAIVRTTLEQKPAAATQWSRASMSAEAGVSSSTIGRIWKEHGLKPHLIKTFKLSNDKRFAEKLEDVVGLYLNPPENAIVLSCDEKSQMQALDRTQPGLPMKKGRCGTMTHDYKRNGTTTLFAAFNTLDGSVLETCMPRHRHQEWIRFLSLIRRNTPSDKEIHIICDNYATQQTCEGPIMDEAQQAFPCSLHAHQRLVAQYGGTFLSRHLRTPASPWMSFVLSTNSSMLLQSTSLITTKILSRSSGPQNPATSWKKSNALAKS